MYCNCVYIGWFVGWYYLFLDCRLRYYCVGGSKSIFLVSYDLN